VALDAIKQGISRSADAVQTAAHQLKEDISETRTRQQLDEELDRLFMELGVEVYQRIRRGDRVTDSVVVQDIVDRIAEVERRLRASADPAGS
jgi:hypothetical protein